MIQKNHLCQTAVNSLVKSQSRVRVCSTQKALRLESHSACPGGARGVEDDDVHTKARGTVLRTCGSGGCGCKSAGGGGLVGGGVVMAKARGTVVAHRFRA